MRTGHDRLDFTSSLYLGLRHPSTELPRWRSLTLGKPAALLEPRAARGAATGLAALLAAPAACLATSTLHAFVDLFSMLDRGWSVHVDAGAYHVARVATALAAVRGAVVVPFRHHDPGALERSLRTANGRRALVVCDGFCTACARVAPLALYAGLASGAGGGLLVDDTQALGVLGGLEPLGGAGAAAAAGVPSDAMVTVASTAKGLGAPLALVAGPRPFVARFERESAMRVHASPPSAAAVAAAQRGLRIERRVGPSLRRQLRARVAAFAAGVRSIGWSTQGAAFPVQTIEPVRGSDAIRLHRRLALEEGIDTVLQLSRDGRARVSFLFTSAHSSADVAAAVAALARVRPPRRLVRVESATVIRRCGLEVSR